MAEGPRLLLVFGTAAILTAATVPMAIRIARASGFLDAPVGYKSHLRPTPYLGGFAVLCAWLPPILIFGGGVSRYWPLVLCALCLSLVGTVDDRISLSPWLRIAFEAVVAWFLWREGIGWSFLGGDLANLALTVVWVVGIVNAFNLMDNIDGAASTVGGVSVLCLGVLAALGGDVPLAVIAFGLGGALIGFLRHNLAQPARIFLGDGGSMAIGLLLAGGLMAAPMGELTGWTTLAAALVAVGLPVFDTTLVVFSRHRRGAPVLSGATDHTTHRLRASLRSARSVCAVLGLSQAVLCAMAIEATRLGRDAAIVLVCLALLVGAVMIIAADGSSWTPVSGDS
ncbi:MAG: MraY family glycosyltransferase [Solirubrobacterales bacterium]